MAQQDSTLIVNEIIHESKITAVQWRILVLCFLSYVIDGFDILVISYTAPAIIQDWGITTQAMGLVFSAGLLGMALGAMFLGSLADLYGRRIVVATALIAAGLATSGVVYTTTVAELLTLRFVAGLALGAVVASMPAMVGEFSPRLYRTVILAVLFAGAALGSVLGGLVSAAVIVDYGWQSIFLYAGLITVVMGMLIGITVPETISFVIRRHPEDAFERVNRTLKYLGQDQIAELPQISDRAASESASVVSLWSSSRRVATVLIWCAFFLGFMVVYFLTSWMPQIMVDAGLPQKQAIHSAVVIAVGSMVGTPIWGWLGRWWPLNRLVALGFLAGASLIVLFSVVVSQVAPLSIYIVWPVLFFIGVTLMGAYANLYTVALTIYPAQVRSTGLGWCAGLGRAGAVLSPALAGVMMANGIPVPVIFLCFTVPAIVTAVCVRLVSMRELS